MPKITNTEEMKRTDEIESLLATKLRLKENLSDAELIDFYTKIISYLKHSNSDKIAGRPPKTISEDLDSFLEFAHLINLNEKEIIDAIKKFPAIIRSIDNDFYWKYILMGILENEDNTLRKNMLVIRTKDYRIDLKTLYARLCLMKNLGYQDITWSSLIKNSNNEFAKIFTKSKYSKPYKVFDSIEDLSKDKLIKMYPVDYNVLKEIALLQVNNFHQEGVLEDEKKRSK